MVYSFSFLLVLLFLTSPTLTEPTEITWKQRCTDIDDDGTLGGTGQAMALSGDGSILAVGAYGKNEFTGTVRVYECVEGMWTQRGQDLKGQPPTNVSADWFGFSVAMSDDGSVLAVGAKAAGYVRVYEWTGNEWGKRGHDIIGATNLGSSLAISKGGSLVAVGASYDKLVRVFVWTASELWLQVGQDLNGNGDYGFSVALSDTMRLAVGSPASDYVRVHQWTGSVWEQVGQDVPGISAGGPPERSGSFIAISSGGLTLAVNNAFSGLVSVYDYIGGDWTRRGADITRNSATTSFGRSVAMSDDGLVVASGGSGGGRGLVLVYEWDGESLSWEQLGPNMMEGRSTGGGTSDGFGSRLAMSNDGSIIAVGAWAGNPEYVRVYEGPSPTPATNACFSRENLVETEHRGLIAMKDLRIGDLVRVSSGSYEEVYAFGHKNHNKASTYLQIYSGGQSRPLEISEKHMVMVQRDDKQRGFARASSIQVGDMMIAANGEPTTVTLIHSIVRKGLYAPFTYSGTMVVSGIVASNYIACQDSDYLKIGAWTTGLSYHWIAQQFTAGRRLLHRMGLAAAETYTEEEGIASWVAPALRWSKWLLIQNVVVLSLLLVPVLSLLGALWSLEAMATMDFSSVLLALVAVVLNTAILFRRGPAIVFKP